MSRSISEPQSQLQRSTSAPSSENGSTTNTGTGTTNDRHLSSTEAGIVGGIGGLCNVLAGQPLDNIKVLRPNGIADTPLACARHAMRSSGIRGLYAGMSFPLVGVVPVFTIMFGVYDMSCKYLVRAGLSLLSTLHDSTLLYTSRDACVELLSTLH